MSLADFTVPELRKALLTVAALFGILIAFFYMVRPVVVAVVAGVVVAVYLIPFRNWLSARIQSTRATALFSILLVMVPLAGILAYSWIEISGAASYLNANSREIVAHLSAGMKRLPIGNHVNLESQFAAWVSAAGASSAKIASEITAAIDVWTIGTAVFLFTIYYVLTEHELIRHYVRSRVPGRYRDLTDPVGRSMKAVVIGRAHV